MTAEMTRTLVMRLEGEIPDLGVFDRAVVGNFIGDEGRVLGASFMPGGCVVELATVDRYETGYMEGYREALREVSDAIEDSSIHHYGKPKKMLKMFRGWLDAEVNRVRAW